MNAGCFSEHISEHYRRFTLAKPKHKYYNIEDTWSKSGRTLQLSNYIHKYPPIFLSAVGAGTQRTTATTLTERQ